MRIFLAELRKIWTVRSTYFLIFITFSLSVLLISFWIMGHQNVEAAQRSSGALLNTLQQSISTSALLLSFLAIISVGHEYRYNTILYSLSSARHRLTVYGAKLLALMASVLGVILALTLLSWIGFYLGQHTSSVATIPQSLPDFDFIWRMAVLVLVHVVFAFSFTMLVRSLIGASVLMLLLPSTVEQLLGLLLKENTKFLPFTSLYNLAGLQGTANVPVATSAAVVAGYVVVLLGVGALLFKWRDAN